MTRKIDITGQDIWEVIIEGLRARGMEMVRGSGNLVHRQLRDGKWHIECAVEDVKKSPPPSDDAKQAAYARLDAHLDEHYYAGARDDLRHVACYGRTA